MRLSSFCVLLILFLCVPHRVKSQCRNLETRPHPNWCSGFYVCRVGFWVLLFCPRGLVYNPNIRRCDFPQNVDCIEDPSFTTPERETSTGRPVPTRTLPSRTTPNLPTRTLPTSSTPIFPTRTIPTRTVPTRPRQWNGSIEKFLCSNQTSATIPHPICEYFYKCINGKAIELKCEEGLIWNSDRKLCDYPENFTCA